MREVLNAVSYFGGLVFGVMTIGALLAVAAALLFTPSKNRKKLSYKDEVEGLLDEFE